MRVGFYVRAALALSLCSGLVLFGAESAGATTNSPAKPAVIGPLLDAANFAAPLGLGEACPLVGGMALSSGSQLLGAGTSGSVISPFLNQLNSLCSQIGQAGSTFASEGEQYTAPLAVINPVLDPLIAQIAQAVQMSGTTYGASMAPLGPFVAGLGGSLTFFEGSSTYGTG